MTNKVILSGRLGDEPTLRTTASGTSVASFSLATSKFFRDAQGERQEQTEWHRITAFGATARYIGEKLEKGQLAMIEGALHYSKWTDKEGVVRYSTEIVAEQVNGLAKAKAAGSEKTSTTKQPSYMDSDFDDDVPF